MCENKDSCENYKPKPEVFEAEYENYGTYKFIKINNTARKGDLIYSDRFETPVQISNYNWDASEGIPRVDFATPAERERFERVRAEMEKPVETKAGIALKDSPIQPEPVKPEHVAGERCDAPAHLSDYAVERNGVTVLMQYVEDGGIKLTCNNVLLGYYSNTKYNNATIENAELLARFMGCVIAPSNISE